MTLTGRVDKKNIQKDLEKPKSNRDGKQTAGYCE